MWLASAVAGALALSATHGLTQTPPAAATAAAPRIPTAAEFGRTAAIRNVVLSPDGKHIAALTSPDGVNTNISVWRTDALSAPPKVIPGGDRVRFSFIQFLKNDRLLVSTIQTLTVGATKTHAGKELITDLEGKAFTELLPETGPRHDDLYAQVTGASIIDTLPSSPTDVLVMDSRADTAGDILRVNVYNGRATRVDRSTDRFGGLQTDLKGEIRARQEIGYEDGKAYIAQWIRDPTTHQWSEHFRWFASSREPQEIIGFSQDPNIVFVRATKGKDKAGIYEYDVSARKFLEPIFETRLFDASRVIQSRSETDRGRILGFVYDGEVPRDYWVDPKLASLAKGLRQALGITTTPQDWTDIATGEKLRYSTANGADIEITQWSNDLSMALVVKSGPRQPPEYYLLTEGGKLTLLGRSQPWIETTALGDTRLVQYPARDGQLIPAFLTTPNKAIYGAGPYPTIVVPHGGPWARDDMGWDASGWTQYFAARGYAVLQPQYRGSEGWGQKLWRAGDNQWGLKMQDDKDDGAKWLIAQGVAIPDRIAMHGYSYGGYAAMAAAVRPNGIYQCAVAGAGVAELERFRTDMLGNRFQREYQRPTVDGMSPLEHAAEVSIPIFLYHGDRDTTVDPKESDRFVAALKAAGKPVKFLALKDMGHQYVLWQPGQVGEVLTAVENYLRTDCGPGGL